jgi:Tol biopolymer transport system component
MEIWKMSPDGRDDQAVQVTSDGGYGVWESPDGRFLYYSKGEIGPGLWKIPSEGGESVQVLEEGRYFQISENGIYYARRASGIAQSFCFYSFGTGQTEEILESQGSSSYFSLSPDGRFLIYSEIDQAGRDLMLVENFH